MAVVESSNRTESQVVVQNDVDQSKPNHQLRSNDQNFHLMVNQQQQQKIASPPPPPAVKAVQANGGVNHHKVHMGPTQHSVNGNGVHPHQMVRNGGGDGGEGFKREMTDLEEMLSKLNPMAEEFVPPSLGMAYLRPVTPSGGLFGYTANNFVMHTNSGIANGNISRRKKLNNGHGKRRMNSRTSMAQQEDVIKRTVTEEQLAALFINCGQVVDCRVCGDPNSVLRFAFVEFTDEEGARNALSLAGTMLGYYPVRVLPSKTAIAPVNPTFLPRVTQGDVKLFFESICGEVHRLRLLGDYNHSTRIAFVEFVMAESAIAALNCSGAVLGSLPIRVSPSKTPVRPRSPRPSMH
ncbi:hypothetical protein RJ640_028308 [Escallonia rubra]|uniref:RRM domain-containing protein n=1 Tax=Escallonia rubra TaxID=112253 RepID=A0AA88S571_9ASTE|nr:hypothetical protein RJ640_028308 [Escallonia rubra]